MHWKDFLYFQRGSKTAVILLLILIVLTLILNTVLGFRRSSNIVLQQNDSLVREFEEFREASKTKKTPGTAVSDEKRASSAERGNVAERSSYETGSGTSPGRREKGITRQYSSTNDHISSSPAAYPAYPASEKLAKGETISLNTSDTTEWKKIPGIGSAYASRIVGYRDLLGGFVHAEQLLEVYGIDQELFSRIAVYIEPDNNFGRLQVNRADFRELLRHPYLNYKQVQAIISIRRKKGDLSSIRELSFLDEFTSEDIIRLEPYLEF